MSTPEERAEAVNEFTIYASKLVGDPDIATLAASCAYVTVAMRFRVQDLQFLVDELKQAKLDRAKLAMLEQRTTQG